MAEGLLVNNATSWKMSLLKTAPHKVSVMSLIVAKPGSIVKEADAIAGPAAPDIHGDASRGRVTRWPTSSASTAPNSAAAMR